MSPLNGSSIALYYPVATLRHFASEEFPISHVGVLSLYLEIRIMPLPWKGVALLYTTICIASDYLNSSQLLMGISPAERPQKALMNASARRALVSKGMMRRAHCAVIYLRRWDMSFSS